MSNASMYNNKNRLFVVVSILIPLALFIALLGRFDSFIAKFRKRPVVQKQQIQQVKGVTYFKEFNFAGEDPLKEWDEKVFKGHVTYRVHKSKEFFYVRALSKANASALYYQTKIDAKRKYPYISWKWKVGDFPVKKQKETLTAKDEDDFAGRVYVIFLAMFFTNSKVLEYIWAKDLPVGTIDSSPYSNNIKLVVLRSGKSDEWFSEERDIVADYIKAFGKPPELDIGAVAFMTDSDNTETSADAMYADIKIGYMKDTGGAKQ